MFPSFTNPPARLHRFSGRMLFLVALVLLVPSLVARGQAIGAHRGDVAGSGGTRSIQGRVISPTGKMPDTRIRIMLDSSNSGSRTTVADNDGSFNFNNLESGPYQLTIDAGKEFEISRESVYIEGAKPIYNIPVYLRLKPEANPALAGVARPAVELYLKGVEAARAGDTQKSIEHLNAAINIHPQFGLALSELGMQYLKAKQPDKALEALRAAVKLLPDDFSARFNYGFALTEQKKFVEAETELRQALKRNAASAPAHMYLGIALMRLNKLDEAERELQTALKTGGEQANMSHYYLGGIYWAKKDYKHAADELESYLKLNPKAPDAERLRATIKELRDKK